MIELALPEEIFHPLFQDVVRSGCISDGKAWADAIPLSEPEVILDAYEIEKGKIGFEIQNFIYKHFEFTQAKSSGFVSNTQLSVSDHIQSLWPHLTRDCDLAQTGSSLIALPYPYIVPGGRFNEIYYWDSYFTMLGLAESGNFDLIESMIENFAWLIRNIGFIPNGNRTYFLSRSQPPFFSLMISLLAEQKGDEVLKKYLPELLAEYRFWMSPESKLVKGVHKHLVKIDVDVVLNRYFDLLDTPRSEMYGDDLHMAQSFSGDKKTFNAHIRAACESGWDFSSRWCKDPLDLKTIHTGDILPVDLNCLLYHLEKLLNQAAIIIGDNGLSITMKQAAEQRKNLINTYFWDDISGYYYDYDFVEQKKTTSIHASGIFPLFFNLANDQQGKRALNFLEQHLLSTGGVLTTTIDSGQQWDAPNGWAPLQWIVVKAAINFGNTNLANKIMTSWTSLNEQVFKQTGKMLEKYDVSSGNKGKGGEYPVQDGFGWTNGVYLAMKSLL